MHGRLADWVPLLVFAHVLSALAFLAAHGPSIAVLLALRKEREPAAVRGLLALSRDSAWWSWAAWGLLALTGSALAFAQHVWGKPWVWGSVVVLVIVSGLMSPLAAQPFNEARAAAGIPWFDGRRMHPAGPMDAAALERALDRVKARSVPVTILGVVGAIVLVLLMTLKPG